MSKERKIVFKRTLCVDGINVTQEVDAAGNHRIISSAARHCPSDWTGYSSISQTSHYRGTSEFFQGSLPRIFKIVEGK